MTDKTDTDTTAQPDDDVRFARGREHLRAVLKNPFYHVALQLSLVTYFAYTGMMFGSMPVLASNHTNASTGPIGQFLCGTQVPQAISLLFGVMVVVGIPTSMFFVGRSGLSYMRATGNPNKQMKAREDLIYTGVGVGVLMLALIAPELITKFGNVLGFNFANCVIPY